MSASELNVDREVVISAGRRRLSGILTIPPDARGVVAFAHGSGSSRFSPRNQFVARTLQEASLATLLLDLLEEEEADDRAKVFDIELLAERLEGAGEWLRNDPRTCTLPLGYFGASTGAGAALVAAARAPSLVRAVVSRGGRPDLAGDYLSQVQAPTQLIVGSEDDVVIELNEQALRRLRCPKELRLVPGATHLFEEPGTLEEVARLAKAWFLRHLEPDPVVIDDDRDRLEEGMVMFHDRADAARQLARALRGRPLHDPLVLAIPRGGVVTGDVLARELNAELDVVLSRKLRAPDQPELAIGAVDESGHVYLNHHLDAYVDQLQGYLAEERRHQMDEIARRKRLFRAVRPAASVAGRSVIVTDDGIATGSTMIAALQATRAKKPRELIVAVPVASPDRLQEVRRWCDDAVCLYAPEDFQAVGQFYVDFTQVEDEEVVRLLQVSRDPSHQSPADVRAH